MMRVEMGLLDFVNSANAFKVNTGERTLAENEAPLLAETKDRVISPSPQTTSLVDHTIQDELDVNVGKRKKRVAFVSGSPPVKKARTEGITISDSRSNIAGKSPSALRRLIRQSGQAESGSGSVVPAVGDATSSFVTPTLERSLEDDIRDNVRTCPLFGRFVVLSSSSMDINTLTSPQVVLVVSAGQASVNVSVAGPVSDTRDSSAPELETGTLSTTPSQGSSANDFYESQTIDSATALNVYVPKWNITNSARIDNFVTCRNFLDHVTPLWYWAALRNQGDAGFLDAFNINSAQHICMASELRLRYEHEIITKEKFERKFTDSVLIVQQRDAEVADLKVRLEKAKKEAAEVVELRGRVSELDAGLAAKFEEVVDLNGKNSELLGKVSSLESTHGELSAQVAKLMTDCEVLRSEVTGEAKLREEFKSFQDVEARRFKQSRTEVDFELWCPSCCDEVYSAAKCRFALGKVISLAINKGIQEGLEAGIKHGKSRRTLAQVEAYNPRVKDEFVSVVTNFENVSFTLLDVLDSLKDSLLTSIMSTLVLKDAQGNVDSTPEL
ncbi:hypothetical protein Tco_0053921 [Tanacetum coccineum]